MTTPSWYTEQPDTAETRQGVSAPAGFYPDPQGVAGLERWWNGMSWSEQTRRISAPAPEPVDPSLLPGFYPDPSTDDGSQRWWNGTSWSELTKQAPVRSALEDSPLLAKLQSAATLAEARDEENRRRHGRLAGIRINGKQATPQSMVRFGVIFTVGPIIFGILSMVAGAGFNLFLWMFLAVFIAIGVTNIRTGLKAGREAAEAADDPYRGSTV